MSFTFNGFSLFILVFARMGGLIFLNPLLSRRNVPGLVRIGLVMLLTILLAPLQPALPPGLDMPAALLRELALGILCGWVYQVFYFMLFFVGDWMDTDFGMAMAKVFDPASNMQMSLSSNLLTIFFTLYFFATGSHLVMLHLFAISFKLVPVGAVMLSTEALQYAMQLFIDVFSLGLRLLLPFVVVEFSLQIVLGIMMKLVPQVHVFVINFQLKLMLGLAMLYLLGATIGTYLNSYISHLLDSIQRMLVLLG